MSRLSQAARNGALAAIGLYLISTSTVLVLSYATCSPVHRPSSNRAHCTA